MRGFISLAIAALLATSATAQDRVARVGVLTWRDAGPYHDATHKGFVAGLREQGFVEGRNLELLGRSADFDGARFRGLARDLVQTKVDVFFAPATPMATAAWYADRNVPIVVATILDPVELQFVKSLARPGTRVTGVTSMTKELTGKRMQMLMQTVPNLRHAGVIVDEVMRDHCKQEIEAMDAAAKQLGLTLSYAPVSGEGSIDAAFRKLSRDGAQAVMTTLTSTRNGLEKEYAEASLRYRLPSMSEFSYGPRLGLMMSYGPDPSDVFRRAGQYVGRILKGGKPAEMAMEEPTRFQLAVNLQTAKALGVTIPRSVMALADEVIE
jgi:putative ABC transport system substrate-binding protein